MLKQENKKKSLDIYNNKNNVIFCINYLQGHITCIIIIIIQASLPNISLQSPFLMGQRVSHLGFIRTREDDCSCDNYTKENKFYNHA